MKSLLKNYIDLLTVEKLNNFGLKNDIHLSNLELEFLLDLVKNNFDDIIINDQKYLNIIKNKFDEDNYKKIETLYLTYKAKYKDYLL